jgi:hypothetical protein
VRDAKGLLEVAKEGIARHGADSDVGRSISSGADLLCALLIQDIKETSDGKAEIVKGVAKDRIVSVTDPEMRHGRKSAHQRFDGHKATVAADAQTGLITDVDILPGNAHDSQNVVEVVERSDEAVGEKVETIIGDSAYGVAAVRQEMEDCGRQVVAKVVPAPRPASSPNGISKLMKSTTGLRARQDISATIFPSFPVTQVLGGTNRKGSGSPSTRRCAPPVPCEASA